MCVTLHTTLLKLDNAEIYHKCQIISVGNTSIVRLGRSELVILNIYTIDSIDSVFIKI